MSLLEAWFLFDHQQTLDSGRPLRYGAAGAARRGDPAAVPRLHEPTEAAGPKCTHLSALGSEVSGSCGFFLLVTGNFSFLD